MNVDQQTRDQLRALTEDVVGGPDLAVAIRAGRRRRRTRLVVTGGVATGLSVAALGVGYAVWPHDTVATDPTAAAGGPAYPDFVAGTQIDEQLQATVATQLPALPTATDVYPSDWNTDGPMPDSQWQDATDWQAVYELADGQRVTVAMGKAIPGQKGVHCLPDDHGGGTGQPECVTFVEPGGAAVVADSYRLSSASDSSYTFTTTLTRGDGSQVAVLDQVQASSWPAAVEQRALDTDEVRPLVTDPAMTFPDPVVTPPPPSNP